MCPHLSLHLVDHLSEVLCAKVGKYAYSHELLWAVDALMDTDQNGSVSRNKFENAHQDTSHLVEEYCVDLHNIKSEKEVE